MEVLLEEYSNAAAKRKVAETPSYISAEGRDPRHSRSRNRSMISGGVRDESNNARRLKKVLLAKFGTRISSSKSHIFCTPLLLAAL